jgi:plastocyanin
MKRVIILVVVAVVLIGIIVFLYTRNSGEVPALSPIPTLTPIVEETSTLLPIVSESKVVVTYSDSGYSPATATVKKDDTVVFDNESSKMMWTASAVHPTHKAYPGSDIAKCGTAAQSDIFDACRGYGSGESWEFQFNESGTWKYHNHLQPSHAGTVIVE